MCMKIYLYDTCVYRQPAGGASPTTELSMSKRSSSGAAGGADLVQVSFAPVLVLLYLTREREKSPPHGEGALVLSAWGPCSFTPSFCPPVLGLNPNP